MAKLTEKQKEYIIKADQHSSSHRIAKELNLFRKEIEEGCF